MSNVIEFPNDVGYKVLFSLPEGKVLKMNKTANDDFAIEIKETHGTAWVRASGKNTAANRVKGVFPDSEIVEVVRL